ncbi:uncharacterized protein LOC119682018 isoform X2 [Teleopsis dalmanni]|nr:uncharacterized protein LOC119682018 isoform X2 [Teleopsis dalmanni]XP_037951278.1 uncharacterized protein LOC119682018 isoform X2 [Teleopsis dalmanni]
MDPMTIFLIIFYMLSMIIFGPIIFLICIYLPEIPVRYIKSRR